MLKPLAAPPAYACDLRAWNLGVVIEVVGVVGERAGWYLEQVWAAPARNADGP